jgi:hypothetical protein
MIGKPNDFKIIIGASTSRGPNTIGKCHLFLKEQNFMFSFLGHSCP